ncbi:MAG: fibronectin type III domain-containing protein [Planctomycetes bacterium]|nr:fibronectin type III domain-containing protein [Planctomycetota bacterium]
MNAGPFLRLALAALAVLGGCSDTLSQGAPSTKPTAPAGLAGLLQGGGVQIALSWTDASSDEAGFRLEVNLAPFGAPPYADVLFLAANSTAYVYLTQPNTTYYFRIYAITGISQSDPSNVITLTTPNFPGPPFYFTANATGSAAVDVHWLNAAGTTGNTVQRSTDQVVWTQIFNNATGPGVVGVSDSAGLAPNTVYYYRGNATSALGTSNWSPVASTRTQTTPAAITTVTTGPPLFAFEDIGTHSSLAFNPGVSQVIASYDITLSNLCLTTGGFPGPYFTQTIDGLQGSGYYGVSVAGNGTGTNHVVSHYFAGNELRYVTNETGPYVASSVDFGCGRAPVVRVSPTDGSIHIVYRVDNSPTGDGWLRHAYRTSTVGSLWTIEPVTGYEPVLKPHSFVIDAAGTPHVIYARQSAGVYEIAHGTWGGPLSGWSFEVVVQQGQPDMNSVAVGAGNTLHVAYNDETTGALMYATNVTGPWTFQEVHRHTSDNIGRHNSILYFPRGAEDVHIAYYDVVFGNLWYAGKPAIGGTWNKRLVDSAGDVGRSTSIGSDGTDIYISYYDAGNAKLKILKNPQN